MKELEEICKKALEEKDEQAEKELRRRLAEFSPPRLIGLILGPHAAPWTRPLREKLPERTHLLRWVYGRSVAAVLSHVRLPTETKRALVRAVLRQSRKRDPWLTSRTLHALAFAPGYFNKTRGRPERGTEVWGPLYTRRAIPRGKGRPRILHIPNPPLRRVQRVLLRILWDSVRSAEAASRRLQPIPVKRTIFENALAHLGQQFVVTLDLRDFFPSVPFDDIVRGLMELGSPAVREPIRKLQADREVDLSRKEYPWTTDAAVLAAKLCTRRRRLPQGAPTSPLLADLAFALHDRRIQERLGQDVIYTRYFDDLTVSFSRKAAGQRGIETASQAREWVVNTVSAILGSTPYRIHPGKTHTTDLEGGHQITGLRVSADRIEIPRSLRRKVRALAHNLSHASILAAARRLIPLEEVRSVRYDRELRSHYLATSRLSLERLAGIMLRQVDPDLRFERFHESASSGPTDKTGREALRSTERLLWYIWNREVTAESLGADMVSVTQKDVPQCNVYTERFAGFFALSLPDAARVILFWHRARGLAAFLMQAAGCREAEGIADMGRKLREALAGVEFRGSRSHSSGKEEQSDSGVQLDPRDDLEGATGELIEYVREFSRVARIELPRNWDRRANRVQQTALDETAVISWLKGLDFLLVRCLSKLPPAQERTNPIEVLRIAAGIGRGERQRDYRVMTRYEGLLRGISANAQGRQAGAATCSAQLELTRDISRLFRNSVKDRPRMGEQEWLAGLEESVWTNGAGGLLRSAADRFAMVHGRLSVGFGDVGLFKREAHEDLERRQLTVLRRVIEASTLEDRWQLVFDAAWAIHMVCEEGLAREAGGSGADRLGLKIDKFPKGFSTSLRRVRKMRNFRSHPRFGGDEEERQKRESDMGWFQRWAAKSLGREIRRQRGSRPEDKAYTFEIMNLEATELKARMIQDVTRVLSWVHGELKEDPSWRVDGRK